MLAVSHILHLFHSYLAFSIFFFSVFTNYNEAVIYTPAFLGHVSSANKEFFKQLYIMNLDDKSVDHNKIYRSLYGLQSLGQKYEGEKLCSLIETGLKSPKDAVFAVRSASIMGSCKKLKNDFEKYVNNKLKEDMTSENLFLMLSAANSFNIQVQSNSIMPTINKIKTTDSSSQSLAFLLQSLAYLNLPKTTVKDTYLADLVKMLEQADELDGNQILYDRGIYTTAAVAHAMVKFIDAIQEIPEGVGIKLVKIFNFLLTRLHTSNVRTASEITAAFKALSDSPYLNAVVIELADGKSPALEDKPVLIDQTTTPVLVELKLRHIWQDKYFLPGGEELQLIANHLFVKKDESKSSGGSNQDESVIIPKPIDFKKSEKDNIMHRLTVNPKDGFLATGRYDLILTAQDKTKKRTVLGVDQTKVPLSVLTEMKLENALFTVSDKVHGQISNASLTQGLLYKATSNADGSIVLESDQHVAMQWQIVDAKQKPLKVHQFFVRLVHKETKQVITFVCDESSLNMYKLTLDPYASPVDFDYLSGIYHVGLIIGDELVKNPLTWHMFDLTLRFDGEPGVDTKRRQNEFSDPALQQISTVAGSKRSSFVGQGPMKVKPEISHLFNTPEKRASNFLSLLFTGLICVVPSCVLIFGWLYIGINLSNYKFSISGTVFHLGVISIFYLYFVYWYRLDMFTTLGYLFVLGLVTFLSGNSLLRSIVADKQQQQQQQQKLTANNNKKK